METQRVRASSLFNSFGKSLFFTWNSWPKACAVGKDSEKKHFENYSMLSFRSLSSFKINVSSIWMTIIIEDKSGLLRVQEVDTVTVSRPQGIRFDPAASLFIGQVHA
jgi:hypothetical protein